MKKLSILFTLLAIASVSQAFETQDPQLKKYEYIDKNNIVPQIPLVKMLKYYDEYVNRIANKNFITIIDMSQRSDQKRQYVIDMKSGLVYQYLTSHGQGSDSNHDGYAEKFSNVANSHATSLGLYFTSVEYKGSNGRSMRLKGMQATNSNAESRAIVVHGADYVSDSYAKANKKVGRSYGCPAVDRKYLDSLVTSLKGGSVFYVWHPQLEPKS